MKKLICFILTIMTLLPAAAVSAKDPAVFLYVSQTGNDSWSGTFDYPLKTLETAIKLAEDISGTVVINIRQGTYHMTDTIKLTSRNSNLVIRAYPGENVLFTGGTEIPLSGFKKCTDAAFLDALIDKTYKDEVIYTNILDAGVTNLGKIMNQGFLNLGIDQNYMLNDKSQGYAPTLSYDDKVLTIAKYPNEGYLYTETIIRPSGSSPYRHLTEIEYTLSDKRYQSWSKADVWAIGYFTHDWSDSTAPAKFTEKDTIIGYSTYPAAANRRVSFFNIPEELDTPGEYYLDRSSGMLYLIPTPDMKMYKNLIFSSSEKTFFNISNAKNITFSSIKFSNTCGMGIYASRCEKIVIDNCEIACIGNAAVYFYKCYSSGVKNSYLHDLGSWGVFLCECGDRKTLTPGNCFVTNCHIRTFSQYRRTYSPGIHLYNDVGSKVSHNEIHDAPHFAIRYEGNDMLFEYNDIYDVCQDTSDTGAIYTGRRYDTRGNIIRYNYFHDLINNNRYENSGNIS